jgi:lysophospholipase L1-like esterase
MNMKKITFVGSLMNGPSMVAGMPFPKKYEAVSGITISGIDGHIPSPGLNDVPHIVLVHIGTNDMYMSPAGAPDRLGTLIDGIAQGAPNALIVVAQIIPLPSGAAAVKTFNDALPAVVKKRADAGKHVILADLFTGFPTSELVDGVHPGQPGCSRMAEKWFGAISSYLN